MNEVGFFVIRINGETAEILSPIFYGDDGMQQAIKFWNGLDRINGAVVVKTIYG